VKLLANPMVVRAGLASLSGIAAFALGWVAIRMLRRRFVEDDTFDDWGAQETSYPYSAVIQELKQQKFALQHEQQEQQRRAKTSEHVTAAVIANLPCGILFIASNGLVKQANVAAKKILGFASPLGMSVEEVFRDARGIAESGAWLRTADVLKNALKGQIDSTDFSYDTPAGLSKSLKLSLIPLSAPSGESLGVAAVIADESAAADQRRSDLLRAETCAEMALELHTSLATIRECARQIAGTENRELAANLANDISIETERLGRAVGGYLARARGEGALAAKA
jgi:signal transduction histidine kinase